MAPKTMKRFIIAHRNGIDGLEYQPEAPVPELRSSTDVCTSSHVFQKDQVLTAQIRINVKCMTLNNRDVQIVNNDYPAPHPILKDCVPVAGELY